MPTISKYAKYSCYLTADQVEKIRRLSEVTRISQANLVREGVDLVLERHSAKLPAEKDVAVS